MNNAAKAKAILAKIMYTTIASVSKDGKPWNAPVFYAYDRKYNLYWGSHRDSQHSKNIRVNKNVFLVIYDSTADAGTGEGIYIEAIAAELKNLEEIKLAHNLLKNRHKPAPFWKLEEVKENAPIRLYRAKPKNVCVNGGKRINGTYIDTRVKIDVLK